MNAKTKLGIGVLLFLFACLIVSPVSAQSVIVKSELSPSFSMTVANDGGILSFPLTTVGTNEKLDGNLITASGNTPFVIKMKDNLGSGKMRAFDTGSGTYSGATLTNPLQVSLNGVWYPMSATDQIIHAGTPGEWNSPIKLKQVTTFQDVSLTGTKYYNMEIMITGNAGTT